MAARKQGRASKLAHLLRERHVLRLKEAADFLDVSEMTIRRDVAENVELFGYLGGHIVLAADFDGDAPYELAEAAKSHAHAKREACANAFKFVLPEQTIFVDCGTTLTYLIDMIPEDLPITAICYALNVAEKIAWKPNITMVMLGGVYQPASASFAGDSAIEQLNHFGINTAFISAAGLDLQRGASCTHFHEAQIKRKVMSLAQKNVLVLDQSKIGKLKSAFFADIGKFDAIITEHGELALPGPLQTEVQTERQARDRLF
jgi:DeoR family deoxyribose operon repressor